MTESGSRPARQYELDWLKVLVIINVIVFHAAWLITCIPGFSSIPKGGLGRAILLDYVVFVVPWQMPVLFFAAGMASCVSLRHRSARDYAVERVKRLLAPLVFGMLFWFPLMAYFWPGVATEKGLSDYVLRYWPECIGMIHNIQLAGRPARPGWSHLWFIAYLLIISLIVLPLAASITRKASAALRNGLARLLQSQPGAHLLSLPLIVVIAAMSPTWPMYQNSLLGDWAWFTLNTIAFLYGYLLCTQEAFWQTIDRHMVPSSVLAVGCGIVVVWFGPTPISAPSYTLRYLIYSIVVGFYIWFAIAGLLGLSRRFLTHTNQALRYFAPASYALYFLHLFLMVIIGSFVVQWGFSPVPEFLLLTLFTFGVSLAIYEGVVRRFSITRSLFGLK